MIDPQAQVHAAAWVAEEKFRCGPHASVLERCSLGEDVVIGAGAVPGRVGFQTVRTSDQPVEMRHAGGLIIGDRTHVLPGAVIATGLFRKNTEISYDARVGARAFVSHAVHVGEGTFIGHGAIVNGGVNIGSRVSGNFAIAHRNLLRHVAELHSGCEIP